MTNFYQNHRRFMKSRSNDQLFGNYKIVDQLSDCDPIHNSTGMLAYQRINLNKKVMDDNAPATPCGLIAKSYFNDKF